MASSLELDVRDLIAALKGKTAIVGKDTWDPEENTVSGLSYHQIEEGFVLCIQDCRVLLAARSRLIRRDYVTFQYTQSGRYHIRSDGQAQWVRSGSVRMHAIPETISVFHQPTELRGLSIFVQRSRLVDCFGLRPELWPEGTRSALSCNEPSSLALEMPLSPEIWLVLEAILDCKFDEPIRHLYLCAKATELLTLSIVGFNKLSLPGMRSGTGQAAREQRLIETAALIYRKELNRPPTVEELSRRLGLNRNRLTSGFQSTFGVTPADYSRKLRMRWARQRLLSGEQVSIVAAEVGYDSLAAFGRAFRKHYGYPPSEAKGGDGE